MIDWKSTKESLRQAEDQIKELLADKSPVTPEEAAEIKRIKTEIAVTLDEIANHCETVLRRDDDLKSQ